MYYLVRLIFAIALFFPLFYIISVKKKNKIYKILILIIFVLFYTLSTHLYFENIFGFKSAEKMIEYKSNGNLEKIMPNSDNNNYFMFYSKNNGDLSFMSTYEKNGRWYFNKLKTNYVWCGNNAVAICKESKSNDCYLVVMFVDDEQVTDNRNSEFQHYDFCIDNQLYYTNLSDLDNNYKLNIDNITYQYSEKDKQFNKVVKE